MKWQSTAAFIALLTLSQFCNDGPAAAAGRSGAPGTVAAGVPFVCQEPPTPPYNFSVNTYYSDAAASIIDPTLYAAYQVAVAPVNTFQAGIASYSSAYMADPVRYLPNGLCALHWVSVWAQGQALEGVMGGSEMSYYERKWTLAESGLVYAKLRHLHANSRVQNALIIGWLSQIADLTIAHRSQNPDLNNHYYWEGLAVSTVGALTGNRVYSQFGKTCFAFAMSQVLPDGSLPLEMARGARALHYHVFAAAALTALASVANVDSPKLRLLVNLVNSQLSDTSYMQSKAGAVQVAVTASELAWFPIYLRRDPNSAMSVWWSEQGSPSYVFLGGTTNIPNPLEHF